MKIKKMIITGDGIFLRRYQPLFAALSLHVDQLETLPGDQPFRWAFLNQAYKIFNKLIYIIAPMQAGKRQKNAQTFIAKSKRLEGRIQQMTEKPDFVLHIFSMYCPFWNSFHIPYGMYLDYTIALVNKNWLPWAPFATPQDLQAWLACEGLAYQRAHHLFAMSKVVESSLIQDYGVDPRKITVVGSFANRHPIYVGEKTFGDQQILFNGAEFKRKGGDIVLAAFERVKKQIPAAKLVVIGLTLAINQDGVDNLGSIGSIQEMQKLLLGSDLVVAPGRCDPFPSFIIEAMNYGVPCIVSGNDGMPEMIDHGINGFVLNPLTPEHLAEMIIYALGNMSMLMEMSQQARQKVAKQLNQTKIAEVMIQKLRSSSPEPV